MIIKGSREELEEKAAWIIADTVQELSDEKESITLAVPGGRSVANIFSYLKDEPLPWEKLHIFIVDERLVPLGDKESNYVLVKKYLVNDELPKSNVHPFTFNPDVSDKGTVAYEEELAKFGSQFDILLVSSGEDGHIGGLYPNHHSVTDKGSFITMDDSPKNPPQRMSSSVSLLKKSGVGIIVFFGEAKQEALTKFLEEGEIKDCPARLIQELPLWYCLTDQETD